MTRDWHAWHEQYDDRASSLRRRLDVVREQLRSALTDRAGETGRPVRLVSLCSGDGRDTLPVLAALRTPVEAVLVELDPGLSQDARLAATELGVNRVDVRTADAGLAGSFIDGCPADVLMLCGVFGNVIDADVERTVASVPGLLAPGGVVIWTRGRRVGHDPSQAAGDPSGWIRTLFLEAGLAEAVFVCPDDAGFRVGVHRKVGAGVADIPERLFSFV
ncbi:MAG: class I SAM-dependent methyltransferase [Nocardioidaceae bacterium]